MSHNTDNEEKEFFDRMKKQPELRNCMNDILDVVENADSKFKKVDEAETQTINELRKLGSAIIHSWANNRIEESVEELKGREESLRNKGKKDITWHSTFGDIRAVENVFSKDGHSYRPFSDSAEISGRQCSLPLQKAIVDFGADDAFGRVPKKLQEHYGLDISSSTVATITETHAREMVSLANKEQAVPETKGCGVQIGEMDGSMIPIVTVDKDANDRRKNKELSWKEAKLSIVHEHGSVTPKFGAVFTGSVDDAGQSLLNAAIMSGFGNNTYMHSVGDGATWIANQIESKFGLQGHYLIDMYHVADYLYDAGKTCSLEGSIDSWVDEQKELLKNNQYKKVLSNLKPKIESVELDDSDAPVRRCFRYLDNRQKQLNYKYAIDHDLPIGSGEIESAHRYIIQKRLKLAGAWWTEENANAMLALRIVRANDMWKDYWDAMGKAA